VITYIYHVPNLSANLLLVSQLTQTGKKVEFWRDKFILKDTNNDFEVVAVCILDRKDRRYKFCEFKGAKKTKTGQFALIAKTNDRSKFGMKD
jgi:hypothetical protein